MAFFLLLHLLKSTSYFIVNFSQSISAKKKKKKRGESGEKKNPPWLMMSENDKATTRSGNNAQEHGQEQLIKIGEQQNRIVRDMKETRVDDSQPMGSCRACQEPTIGEQETGQEKIKKERLVDSRRMENPDEASAPHEQHVHQQSQSVIIARQEIKDMSQQRLTVKDESGEIRKSREPLSVSEQFEKFDRAEAKGLASRVAPYYWRPIPPALRKLNGMDKYNLRPAWNSPPPSPIQR